MNLSKTQEEYLKTIYILQGEKNKARVTDIAKRLLDKFGLEYNWLKCGLHPPLYDKNTKEEMEFLNSFKLER